MIPEMNNTVHIIVDMLYDFIDGSLACQNGEEAVKECINHIESNPLQKVVYIMDHHPINHCSFMENGGIWPVHCVAGTRGGEIHGKFNNLKVKEARPSDVNRFYKGTSVSEEQYSGFYSVDYKGRTLDSLIPENVIVSGIATEFCVKETCLDLLKSGRKVSVLKDALAYVDRQGHEKTLEELTSLGVKIV